MELGDVIESQMKQTTRLQTFLLILADQAPHFQTMSKYL